MHKYQFLDDLIGENMVYEHIIDALIAEPHTADEITEYVNENGVDYTKRTVSEKLRDLQRIGLVEKQLEMKSRTDKNVYYRLTSYQSFKSQMLDNIRVKAKRNIFQNKEY